MASNLFLYSIEEIQDKIAEEIKKIKDAYVIYISLNKSYSGISLFLKSKGINIEKIFFIDCVSSKKVKEDVLNIQPVDLEKLYLAIETFINEIEGNKILFIDSLSTLLIYNKIEKVAEFVKKLTVLCSDKKVEFKSFSVISKGEELLNRIFTFFDKVYKNESQKKLPKKEDLIY